MLPPTSQDLAAWPLHESQAWQLVGLPRTRTPCLCDVLSCWLIILAPSGRNHYRVSQKHRGQILLRLPPGCFCPHSGALGAGPVSFCIQHQGRPGLGIPSEGCELHAERRGRSVESALRNTLHTWLSESRSPTLHTQNGPRYLSISKRIHDRAEPHERTLGNQNGHTKDTRGHLDDCHRWNIEQRQPDERNTRCVTPFTRSSSAGKTRSAHPKELTAGTRTDIYTPCS